jgi:hypothetical protein
MIMSNCSVLGCLPIWSNTRLGSSFDLDWWEIIRDPGSIPLFHGCNHVMLTPPWSETGLKQFDDEDGLIRFLHVIPITPVERHLLKDHGREALLAYLDDQEIDLFSDRQDDLELRSETQTS